MVLLLINVLVEFSLQYTTRSLLDLAFKQSVQSAMQRRRHSLFLNLAVREFAVCLCQPSHLGRV